MTHPDAGAVDARPPRAAAELLTPEQLAAVRHGPGPLLLVAGPGAGKTRTLAHRIAHLLTSGRASPSEILAVTFSVRAVSELRLRLSDLFGERNARGVTTATFHSVCARMLREHAALFGRTETYTVYDEADVRKVIDWLLCDAGREAVQAALAGCGQPASKDVLEQISLAKNRLLSPDAYERAARYPAAPLVAAVWRELDLELRRSNAFDFDDLLVGAVRLLAEHPHQLTFYRQRWRWLLVDEFQDTNEAQSIFAALLAGAAGNITVVADDDQLIYTWRGAEPQNVLGFGERFPGHTRIVLGRNFRSRAEVLGPAVACVAHNARRTAKTLMAVRGGGGQAHVTAFAAERHEAEWVAGTVADALTAGLSPSEILVLARTGYAMQPTQGALAAAGIAYRVLGGLGLYERSEVRDALAYVTLIANPADAQAFRRAVQAPRRGVGVVTANRVVAFARHEHDGDLIAASRHARTLSDIRSHAARDRLAQFGAALERVRVELLAGRSVGHVVVGAVMVDGGLVRSFQERSERLPASDERRDVERVLEELRSLCRAAQAYEEQSAAPTLTGFLEHVAGLHAQEVEPGQEDRRITVSTIHRAKGSEARLVVLVGCEEELLPSWRSLAGADPGQLEEERRLFYVACTRAKDRLLISHAAMRNARRTGGPSRFLAEAGLINHSQALAA